MEAGVAVPPSRSSFRKPSHATSQRNYRRRSPSSSSRSPSRSTSPPHQASSGGWKRDRSASPSSPQRGGEATNSSLHSKKGRRGGHTGNDGSDGDNSQGRYGDSGPGVSERQVRGASYDRYAKPDFRDSKRSGSYVHERNYSSSHGRYSGRDFYADTRRNGDYDYSGRSSRRSPDRGYRDSGRSRDKDWRSGRDRDRDSEGYARYRSGGRGTNMERDSDFERQAGRERDRDNDRSKERVRDRDRDTDRQKDRERDRHRYRDSDRDRDRERSRRRSPARDSYYERDDDDTQQRRYGGSKSKSRDSKRDRDQDPDRERQKSKSVVRDISVDREVEAGEIESDISRERRERDKSRDRNKGRDAERRQSKSSGEREVTHPIMQLDIDDMDWSGDKGREVKKEITELNGDMDIDTEKATWERERIRDDEKYRERDGSENRVGRDLLRVEMDTEKDVERSRDKVSRGRSRDGGDRSRDREYSESPDRHNSDHRDQRRVSDRVDSSSKARDRKSKEKSIDNRSKDRNEEEKERSVVHRDDRRNRDGFHDKEDRSGNRSEKARSGRGIGFSEHVSHRGDRDRDRNHSSSVVRSSGRDERRTSDTTSGKEKIVVKLEKETQPSIRVKEEVDGSYHSETRDGGGEGTSGKDRKSLKRSQESSHPGSSLPASASDSDTKGNPGSDAKAAKGSKWGPETSDSATVKSLANDELANDLTAAKLAAMKAAELVNKNLGVAGFMSADQKKRLLWGSKKLPPEQETVAAAAGINRWDTVHFSDPDRQEKFQKLMGVKADTCTEPNKKEGDPDVNAFTEERQRELQQDLEKQFTAGLRRRDGGKVGLGL